MAQKHDYIDGLLPNLYWLIKYKVADVKRKRTLKKQGIVEFGLFGVRCYTGEQGTGKTMGMVEALARARDKYPQALIVTNFDCKYADRRLTSLNDLLTIKNGEHGVIFGIDELQNEFSSKASKDFPENLLDLITQQRKQRITIFCTSQVFSRLAKPLREQTYYVCMCKTWFKRLTRIVCYKTTDYQKFCDSVNEERRYKVSKEWAHWFVQTDALRNSYDTYSVIKRLSRKGFVNKVWQE